MSCPFSGKGKGTNHGTVHVESLKSEVRNALVTPKSFAGPIALRVAWHASGTYDKNDGTGGSNGGTMRFPEEASHGANKGLSIVRDMLHEVHKAHPEISEADLWTFAGCVATEFMGGPQVPFRFGRWDDDDSRNCPPDGRIPDGALGADHIRDTFGRMGFNDQEMVALIGAHTVGRCHLVRSGWDGPWTNTPLEFNNEYFVNLIEKDWRVKEWDGPEQWEDVETGTLMMLPTDMALKTDPHFRPWAELYARDEEAFFRDFAAAYAKLMSLGCPEGCDPFGPAARASTTEEGERAARFRELAMHGSVGPMEELAPKADIFELEPSSSRSALHKAAFWGHVEAVGYLVNVDKAGRTLNIQDYNGDTALHDAARFGHLRVCQILREAGADLSICNNEGQTAAEVAVEYGKDDVAAYLARGSGRTSRL